LGTSVELLLFLLQLIMLKNSVTNITDQLVTILSLMLIGIATYGLFKLFGRSTGLFLGFSIILLANLWLLMGSLTGWEYIMELLHIKYPL
jgi:hypothetical protein